LVFLAHRHRPSPDGAAPIRIFQGGPVIFLQLLRPLVLFGGHP